tara:strand:- start:401 stop:655 length:255 start_codon:yes stop_codon:yes gene_type:complete
MLLVEGLLEKIVRALASKAAKRAIKKAIKLAPKEDDELKAEFETLRQQYERLDKHLDNYCKRKPQAYACRDRKKFQNPSRWGNR